MFSEDMDESTPLFAIATAAELSGLHPQTLRQYDRLGLVSPTRTAGQTRRYSMRDIVALREIQTLSAEGLNLEGYPAHFGVAARQPGASHQGASSRGGTS